MQIKTPVCLVFAGNDPCGGAGIQADIEALASMGCHAAPVVTALTVQDTRNVIEIEAVSAAMVISQARAVLEDLPVAAIKIGLLPSIEVIEAIHSLLVDCPGIPVVLDPVLRAGGGRELMDVDTQKALWRLLFSQATVLTPNGPEVQQLSRTADTLDACGMALLESGCEYVLLTGGHELGDEVVNSLFGNHRMLERFSWPRLPGEFHGSGCTLASAIAGLLAHGQEPRSAIREAQQYTWNSLKHAARLGRGQLLPGRLFWTEGGAD